MQDPFFAVKEEVEHSVTVVTQLHGKWKELLKSKAKGDEQEWTTSELLSGLRSIEWDLQDLEDTVSIVEGNRQKFQLQDSDVEVTLCCPICGPTSRSAATLMRTIGSTTDCSCVDGS